MEIFGDKWMLLLIRDIRFEGKNFFLKFRASVEKISSAVLSEKLNKLLKEECVFKVTSRHSAIEINEFVIS